MTWTTDDLLKARRLFEESHPHSWGDRYRGFMTPAETRLRFSLKNEQQKAQAKEEAEEWARKVAQLLASTDD